MRTTLFSIALACCFLTLANRLSAQEELPGLPAEPTAQAEDAASVSSVPTESFVPGQLVEVAREVNLDLRLDEAKPPKKVRFKKRDGSVLAEIPKEDKDRLSFEITITSLVGEVSVDLPVPPNSPIAEAYQEFGTDDPDKVLILMDGFEACVRVIALSKQICIEKYRGGCFVCAKVCDHWQPFYEICLPDAGITERHLVKVPLADCDLYQLTRRVINVEPGPPDERVIMTLTGADRFAELDRSPRPIVGLNPANGAGSRQQEQSAGANLEVE